jgi:predicted phosphoadenosine phosphosulfate sulfurtransferase
MKIYSKVNVWDSALERMSMVFDNFETVLVFVSGGKDSTVLMELALETARQKNRLPLKVAFLDQEAEWEATEQYIEKTFLREGIEPYWFQFPFRLFNSSSYTDDWLTCWDPEQEDKWVHPKNVMSIKKNIFGTDRFKDLFPMLASTIFDGKPYAALSGMRAQENGIRRLAVTRAPYFKGVTWSSMHGPHGTLFYPIYDWAVDDIWIAMSRNKWAYNTIYDSMYQYGESIRKMRCSSLIHETGAEHSLILLQEIEPKTYERLAARIGGVDTYSKLMGDIRQYKLPSAFATWKEYCAYLHDTILTPQGREGFDKLVKKKDFIENAADDGFWKDVAIQMQANDYTGTKMENMLRAYTHRRARERKYGTK